MAGNTHSWVHVNTRGSLWRLTAGYPHTDPPDDPLSDLNDDLLANWTMTMWVPNVYLALQFDGDPEAGTVADLIIAIMNRIQHLSEDAIVEIVMEFNS